MPTLEIYKSGNQLSVKAPTWVIKGCDKDVFAKAFEENPKKASRDYGCEPPDVEGSAFPNPEVVSMNANIFRQDPVDEALNLYGWVVPPLKPDFKGDTRYSYYLHFDLSKANDQTGCGMTHYDYEQGIYYVDLIMRIPVSKDWNLRFQAIENLIDYLLANGFNIVLVTFDGWQSLNIIQILNSKGIKSEIYSVDKTSEAYDTLISLLLEKKLDYYYQELFIKELREIRFDGSKYDHPVNGSKDLADAVAGAVRNCAKSIMITSLTYPDLKDLFNLDYNLQDHILYEQDTFTWKNYSLKINTTYSICIDGAGSQIVIVRGFQEDERFTVDYVDIMDGYAYETIEFLIAFANNTRATFLSAGNNTSYQIIDELRKNHIRIVSGDSTPLDSAQNKGMRIVRMQMKEAINTMISNIKQKNLSLVKENKVYAQMSEINQTNYTDKPIACTIALWLHYMIQHAKTRLSSMPKSLLVGNANQGLAQRAEAIANKPPSRMPRARMF